MKQGIPIVISAPSGTGKTSLCKRLLQTLSNTSRSISFTTRAPRGEEMEGRDYYFVSAQEFQRMIDAGEFVEWADVFGQRYGTGFGAVRQQVESGVNVLLDIDVQGGSQIRSKFKDALLIFLLPPSMDELRRRLVNRAVDAPETIQRRLEEAANEIRSSDFYDFLIVNDDFEQAAEELRAVIRAHSLRAHRPKALVAALLADACLKS